MYPPLRQRFARRHGDRLRALTTRPTPEASAPAVQQGCPPSDLVLARGNEKFLVQCKQWKASASDWTWFRVVLGMRALEALPK